jgi:hypothetical protein
MFIFASRNVGAKVDQKSVPTGLYVVNRNAFAPLAGISERKRRQLSALHSSARRELKLRGPREIEQILLRRSIVAISMARTSSTIGADSANRRAGVAELCCTHVR